MARVNVNILGISKLKWTGMGEFNSDNHYICYCGQESLRKKWSSHHSQQNSRKCSTWMQSQRQQKDLYSFPRQTIHYHSNPSLCPDLVTQTVKHLSTMQETRVWALVWEDPLEKEMAIHSSILARRTPWHLVGLSPWCHKESDTT